MHFGTSGPDSGDIPPVAYQLADHLDAALAAAEDLADAGRGWQPATAEGGYLLAAQMAAERQVIERVRTFEAMLIGRVLKARKRAQALAQVAGDFAGMTRLFVGGTAPLTDAVAEFGDSTLADFDTGECRIAYLRQRGVIAADAADLPDGRQIELGSEGFLVAGRVALGPLTEMIIAFLDALEAHYDLWPDDGDGEGRGLVWADALLAAQEAETEVSAAVPPAADGEAGARAEAMCGATADAGTIGTHDGASAPDAGAAPAENAAGSASASMPVSTGECAGRKSSLIDRLNAMGSTVDQRP